MNRNPHKRTAHRGRLAAILMIGVFCALGSFWLVQLMESGEVGLRGDALRNEPDYIVENFSFVRMTPAGQPRYIISGAKLTHRPLDDVSEVDGPVVKNLSNAAQPPMTITAKQARIFQSKDQVDLFGNVDINRPASPAADQFRLRTEALTILTERDQMKTDRPVHIVSGASTVTGTGLFVDNAARQMRIDSRVHIIYPPAPRR